MGRVTWDPNASEVKRKREESKYPPLKNLGFQFLGCRVSITCAAFKVDADLSANQKSALSTKANQSQGTLTCFLDCW